MKKWSLVFLLLTPLFLQAQEDKSGELTIGAQFYQNTMLPDNYEGFGLGLNSKVEIFKGVGVMAYSFYEANDILSAGHLKRFQNGISVQYFTPL